MDQITPMMRQYMEIKRESKNTILFFRLGDFYEMFFDDAIIASKVLGITLTSRNKGKGQKAPMAGFPYHAAESYIAKLIKAGHKVGICEQVEDPKLAKGLVKRDVVRIITPGTVLSPGLLEDKAHNYLASVCKANKTMGLSFVELSTGEFKLTELLSEIELNSELTRLGAKECLIPASLQQEGFLSELPLITTPIDDWIFSYENAYPGLINHFKTQSLDGFGATDMQMAIGAAGAIIHYLKETQKSALTHISSLSSYTTSEFMILDQATVQNLELTCCLHSQDKQNSLLAVLDQTVTPMGGRLLHTWLQQPLLDVDKLIYRQQGIAQLLETASLRENISNLLAMVYDIERLISRLDCGLANARDLISLKQSLLVTPNLKEKLTTFASRVLVDIANGLEPLDEVTGLIEQAIVETPPLTVREGGLIKPGYNQELDELRNISKGGKSWVAALQKQEIARTKITSLKVGYNYVFGYYIEVTKPNLHLVPQDYIRKQTIANAERFITPELKEQEAMILNAEERIQELEYNIFQQICRQVIKQTQQIQKIARNIGLLDVLVSLAQVAAENDYVQPEVNNEQQIFIKDGRHPVVEKLLTGERFVPNDTLLDSQTDQVLIITGPNMAGKSTYIRQVALIVLMAQIGSFVPAAQATIGLVDRIFTRVGASDILAKGQSTFMVEMNETANILNNATPKSLIILDEVGRGTSTFDGVSIAWAVAEYIHNHKQTQAKTLFATHYHELTELEFSLERVKNYNIAVKEWGDKIIFLRKIVQGGTDRSYGIHVARLAGLPEEVIRRATEILTNLEMTNIAEQDGQPEFARSKTRPVHHDAPAQLSLFAPESHPEVIDRLKDIDVNAITPIEALTKLAELKKMAAGK